MQGKKSYQEKFFVNFRLSERIPPDNFYRRLKGSLDLEYLRLATNKYYGIEGQKSIDPVVFFKLMLVGYLENINSDRKIIEQSSLRMDVLYFLGYDIDEPLPWHSTLSRTRKLFGEEVFLGFFRDILNRCVRKGMVSGRIQAIDSAFIKANASRESMVEAELAQDGKKYFDEITGNEEPPPANDKPCEAKGYNERCASKTDPDSRLSKKRGKPAALNHLGIISVDASSHVICGATVDYADKRDSETAESIVGQTIENLNENGLAVEEVLADKNYSSGKTYRYLASQNIKAYIPPMGSYKAEREGFSYDNEADCYICSKGAKLTFRGVTTLKGRETTGRTYLSNARDCRHCPLKKQCCKSKGHKRLDHSSDKRYYDAAHEIASTGEGKRKMRMRSATVEPVLGTLLVFMRMKKVYTIGQELARKQFLMAAAAYNLKKLMGTMIRKRGKAMAKAAINAAETVILDCIRTFYISMPQINKIFAIR
ncbi:MAG: transposase [Fibromonadaceae bacterium]|jgi:transposase|nr:transposase [Fibromonadaceae bacterium]